MLYSYFSLAYLSYDTREPYCSMALTCHWGFKKLKGKDYQSQRMCVVISPLYSVGSCFRCWGQERSNTGICSDLEDREVACTPVADGPWFLRVFLAVHAGCMPGLCLVWTLLPSFWGHRFSSHRTAQPLVSPPFYFHSSWVGVTHLASCSLTFPPTVPPDCRTNISKHRFYKGGSFPERVVGLRMATLLFWLCVCLKREIFPTQMIKHTH